MEIQSLSQAAGKYYSCPDRKHLEVLVGELKHTDLALEVALLSRYLEQESEAWTGTVPANSYLLGRRVTVSDQLPAIAAPGDLWLDLRDLSLMVAIAKEPAFGSAPTWDRQDLLHGWIGCSAVRSYQFAGYALAFGKPLPSFVGAFASGVMKGEALDFARHFGKTVPDHTDWQIAQWTLPNLVQLNMWDLAAEWSGVRSDFDEDLALVVRAMEFDEQPDDLLTEHHRNGGENPMGKVAFPATHTNPEVGFRCFVHEQFGLKR